MADPVEYLRSAFNAATTPIIPKRWIDPITNAIDAPSLERSPFEARLRGFGAGAVEGLRQQFNPLNIIGSAIPGYRAIRGAQSVGRAASAAAAADPTIDIIESAGPARQVMPSADDVTSLIGDLRRNLARVPSRGAKPAPRPSAGMRDPSLTAVGDEAVYNAGRAANPSPQYGEGFYRDMLARRGGRGPM